MLAGWIDRKGKLHVCLDWEHELLALQLGFEYSAMLDDMLWIRFSEANKRFGFDKNTNKTITQAQIDTCFDLALKCNMLNEFNDLIAFFD